MLSGGCDRPRHRWCRSALQAVPVNNTRIQPAWMARQYCLQLRSVSTDYATCAPSYATYLPTPRTPLHGLALESPPFALRQPAPDAEPLVVAEGVLQALRAH